VHSEQASESAFLEQSKALIERAEIALKAHLTSGFSDGDRLRQAMQYAVFNGGKRLRPLLVYASGRVLGLDLEWLDAPACAVELIHCYSLVHDDLPAMDDDDLRRGRPTAHLAFDEATAILAGDAMQALAFEILATDPTLRSRPLGALNMIAELTDACGAGGMAGGQAQDLQMEGRHPDQAAVERMFALKTGALIQASIMMPCALLPDLDPDRRMALARFAQCVGLAFQIRDDLLDIEGQTEVIGKAAGADQARQKATWPGLFGVDQARERIHELRLEAEACLTRVKGNTESLAWLADCLVRRNY
jgi:geranylgeranyl pyrophosphate synthase